MHSSIRIRRACAQDANSLSVLAEQTFRVAFAASNSTTDMQRHCQLTYGESVQLAEIQDPSLETWVAEDHGRLVAYVQLRSGTTPTVVNGNSPMEIQRFYVDAGHHGQGLAHGLMEHILTRTAAAGADVVWLGVWEHNPRALAFYRKWGFDVVGDQTFTLGDDLQRDLVMRRVVNW